MFVIPMTRFLLRRAGNAAAYRHQGRLPRKRLSNRLGHGASSEAGAKREPHDRSEAVGRRYSHEIQTRYGRFEVGREHGCTLDRIDLRTNLGTKESQAIQIYPVTRRGDDMLGLEFALRTSLVAHLKMHPAVLDMSLFGRAAQA